MSKSHKLGAGQECFGTGVIYAARPEHWIHVQGDYRFDLNGNTYPKESRAYRKAAKLQRKKVTPRPESLRDETVVVFGPDVGPVEAAKLLRELAHEIERRGLFAGIDHLYRKVFDRVIDRS